jgi:transposase
MEARRLRAWKLFQKGWKQSDVAEALGVTRGAVSQWISKARKGGVQALRRRKPPGGPSKLSDKQLALLPELLNQGPSAFGFCGEIWTRRRVAQVMEREFGVAYDPSQVGRILKGCGFSLQKPAVRAAQRDEDAIGTWRERRFAELKKRP